MDAIDGQDIHVNYMKPINNEKLIFMMKDNDESWENMADVVETKVPYIINNRGQYVYKEKINVN